MSTLFFCSSIFASSFATDRVVQNLDLGFCDSGAEGHPNCKWQLMNGYIDNFWSSSCIYPSMKIELTHESITGMLHITGTPQSNLIENAWYQDVCEAMDQVEAIVIVKIIGKLEERQYKLDVGPTWSLSNLRQEILMCTGLDGTRDFNMWIVRHGLAMKKVILSFSICYYISKWGFVGHIHL